MQRERWVDVLKFLGIFAIYLGHFAKMGGLFYEYVFAFHVPLFFFVGGFFYRPARNIKENIKQIVNKFCHIMIPYYIFGLIKVCVESIYDNNGARVVLLQLYEILLGRRNCVGSLWFLTCFFSTIVLITILYNVVRNKYIVLIITFILHCYYPRILLLIGIEPLSLMWNLDSALDYMIYFALGWCIYPAITKLKWNNIKDKIIFATCLVISGLVAAIVYFRGEYCIQNLITQYDPFRIINTLQTMILILFNCICAKMMVGVPYIGEIGKYTLILCGMEQTSKTILGALLQIVGVQVAFTNPLTTIIYTGICIVFCYFIFIKPILKYFPILAGRWNLNFEK